MAIVYRVYLGSGCHAEYATQNGVDWWRRGESVTRSNSIKMTPWALARDTLWLTTAVDLDNPPEMFTHNGRTFKRGWGNVRIPKFSSEKEKNENG